MCGFLGIADELLASGADPDTIGGENKVTALHAAAHQGFVLMVELLVFKGADTMITNRLGLTPLHCAVKRNAFSCVKVFLTRA